MVSRLTRELGRPVRILKVTGLCSEEGPERRKRAAFRTVQANSARVVDEWLPVKDWPTTAVKEWHADALVPYCWTYDSVPGAGDWAETSRHVARAVCVSSLPALNRPQAASGRSVHRRLSRCAATASVPMGASPT